MQLLVVLLLIIIHQSWHYFCADFTHAQNFGDNLPNSVLFHDQITCDNSNSQLTIATHQLPYPLDTDLNFACWKPSASGVIFQPLATLFEPFVPLKNLCMQHSVFTIHSLKHFKCLWGSFPQLDKKFHISSFLGVYHLFLSVHRWMTWKRGGVN